MRDISEIYRQKGQIGLVVLLVMTALLSVGVGAVSKSTRDLKITRQDVEASQAFNAAEVGIEKALLAIELGSYNTTENLSNVIDTVDVSYQITDMHTLEMSLVENKAIMVDVSSAAGNSVVIDWGIDQICPNIPSLVVTVHNVLGGDSEVDRYAFNACTDDTNGFDNTGPSVTIGPILAGDQMIRIKAVGGDTNVVVTGGSLPLQYHKVESTARNSETGVTKKIQVNKGLPTTPSVFDYVLFSGTTITK